MTGAAPTTTPVNAAKGAPAVRGRFAPTPSGRMHLGNVWCALLAWLDVRSRNGELVLRIEDLDPNRVPPQAEELLIDDMRWLGLDWDEGPVRQSERSHIYAEYLAKLEAAHLTYPCFCTRADLHATEAPHASDGTPIYAGTCRKLSPTEARVKAEHRSPGIRLAVPDAHNPAGRIAFIDDVYGAQDECLALECGDFIVRRTDGIHAYQLAVAVDDALMGVNRIVRGRDLLPSTARQIYLQELLGFARPTYAHVPLLLAADGSHRLSKRERDCDLGFMRAHFGKPEILLGKLAKLGGLRPTDAPVSAAELAKTFSWDDVRAHRHDIAMPPDFFC